MKLPTCPTYSLIRYSIKAAYNLLINIDCARHTTAISGPKIYAANHPTTLDPLIVISLLDDKVAALLTGGTFNIPIIGRLLHSSGHIPVFESCGREAYEQALKKLQSGENILIFPEGSLSDTDGGTKPLYSGAVRLAQETGAPIIPIGIAHSCLNTLNPQMILQGKVEHARIITHGSYALTFGEPVLVSKSTNYTLQKQTLDQAIHFLITKSRLRLNHHKQPLKFFGKVADILTRNLGD